MMEIPGLSLLNDVLDIVERGQDLYAWLRDKRTRDLAAGVESARSSPYVYRYLRDLYADLDVLTGPDGPFPMAVLSISDDGINDPETLTGSIVPAPQVLPVFEPRLIEAIRRRGSEIWPGATFSLNAVNLDDRGNVLTVDAYIGNYYDQVCSADYLEYELLAAIQRGDIPTLPQRGKIINSFDSPRECLLNGGGVDATIAISTLVVYKRDNAYWMLCEVRSNRVAEYGALYHVAPSFIFQPVVAVTPQNVAVEWSVRHNVYREYLEEIFNVEEIQLADNNVSPKYFYQNRNLLFLQELEARGSATLFGIGLAFNLLNHRPEILTLYVIDDEDWGLIHKPSSGG